MGSFSVGTELYSITPANDFTVLHDFEQLSNDSALYNATSQMPSSVLVDGVIHSITRQTSEKQQSDLYDDVTRGMARLITSFQFALF
jgi:hypothetical protein